MTSASEGNARALFDRYWEDLLSLEPLVGTQVGDDRFDNLLPDPSPDGIARRETVHRSALAAAAEIDRSGLDVVLRTTLDTLEAVAKRDLASIEHRLDRFGAVNHLWGPGQLLAELGTLQRADTPERLERFLARLHATPAYLDAVCGVVRDAAEVGQTVPIVVVERTIAQVERLLAIPAEESPALSPVPEDHAGDRTTVAGVLRDEVMPAYVGYVEALRRYLPAATETIGLYALPGGEAMYGAEILGWTTLELDPRGVHDVGIEELEAIQEERRHSAALLGFASADEAIAAHQESGNNTAASREELVHLAEEQVRRSWEACPGYFGRLPKEPCDVRPVEEFREADMPFAFYMTGTEDGSRPGIYYVNTYQLEERPLHHLATTTYHEANPGHHLQLTIEQEIEERPALRRFGGMFSGAAFVEGWGLYSERLADEMGLFTDEYERLGMLDAQAHRAARLIVDTGIHALGWTRERAIAKLEEAGVPRVDAVIETDRYIALPAQALAYKIGQREIEHQRRAAVAREGSAFSLSEFHDRMLALGSLPLPSLQRELGA